VNFLYLFPCFDGISAELVPVKSPCRWRWIAQPSFDLRVGGLNWFENSQGVACWVFQSDRALEGFEVAPNTYPNEVPLIDSGVDNLEWQEFKA
jgi:hypothetical protein